jgi:hypothetical protein
VAVRDLDGRAAGLAVVGRTAYVSTWNCAGNAPCGLLAFDVEAPAAPRLLGHHVDVLATGPLRVAAGLAYAAGSGVWMLDVADARRPSLLGNLQPLWSDLGPARREGVALDLEGALLAIAPWGAGVVLADVSSPRPPVRVGAWRPAAEPVGEVRGVLADAGTAFLSDGWFDVSRTALVDVRDPTRPSFLGELDVTGYVAALGPGRLYVAADKLTTVDVTEPAAPRFGGSLPFANGGHATAMAVSGDTLVAATVNGSDEAAIEVVDVREPARPRSVASFGNSWWTAVDIAVDEGFAYVGGAMHLAAVDLRDPERPRLLGALDDWSLDRVAALAAQGDWVYAVTGGGTTRGDGSNRLLVLDVSDRRAPRMARALDLPGSSEVPDIALLGARAFVTHDSGLHVLDLAEPGRPRLAGNLPLPGKPHAVALSGRTLLAAVEQAGLLAVSLDGYWPAVRGSNPCWLPIGLR